uniref:Signal-induced proliferation-associated protein 1 isoform X1 n=1 Tax=Geotrypetes seraphini TaxID=260995 RepID=A0A6P8S1X9_GEOSA|nr:signal-induced proliferation-associated protein 1 isoform X1 [Geotrypetes seraphini]XP_033811804.1 signal-induced proliferation-associated protein 1 isoform X1 [Geotrypetes seraphini]
MQSDDLFIRKIRRHCSRPPLSVLSFEPKGTPTVTSIRTRVEWPPKKEPLCKGLGADKTKGQGPHLALRASGPRSYLMHRSNSDITIGDGEAEVEVDGIGASSLGSPNSGDTLHREYGSLTSIEKPGGSPRARAHSHEEQRSSSPAAQRFRDPFLLLGLPGEMQEAELQFQALPQGSPMEKNARALGRMNSLESGPGAKVLKCNHESGAGPELFPKTWIKQLAHFDVQSILFDPRDVVNHCNSVGQRKNITTGASAASQLHSSGPSSSPSSSTEDLNSRENVSADEGDGKDNLLVLSCPYFRNEIGGEGERSIRRLEAGQELHWDSFEPPPAYRCPNAAVSVLEEPRECFTKKGSKVGHSIEYADLGACYYRKYFFGKEHQNFFGMDEQLGPVAISLRREEKEGGSCPQYNYRIIFRTTELKTLRGSILEEAVPSAARHATPRGWSPKKLLEHVIPTLNLHCLRLASNSPKVPDTLLKLDEQGLSFQRKIGVMYCKSGQSSEEEMYNNETAGPAFQEFLQLLGDEVQLKGFDKYRAQLDNKMDSTGTHSLYTTYQEYEIMFHVSTMLPYTANNRQQLLRKRHIGNDIVTIVFQEPEALPFTPKTIRSHFQHVFIIVRAYDPCSPHTSYSVAVSRTKDIPLFGPFIPEENLFPKSAAFRDFLLAKAINAENAAEKSEKFYAMATRTRQEYLRDLATNYVTTTTIESTSKFALISLGGKKKEKSKGPKGTEMQSAGALVWSVHAWDNRRALELKCLLGISAVFLVLIEGVDRRVIFNCSCRDILAWTFSETSIDIYYEKGDYISMNVTEERQEDIKEIVHRLQLVTRGCETRELTLLRNGVGQLGFQVDPEGFVTEVERFTFAEKAGLQPGARLVRVCSQPLVCLSPQQTADLLRTAKKVTITVVPPDENGKPRRSYSELYLKSLQEQSRRADIAAAGPAATEGRAAVIHTGGAALKPATLQFLRSLSLQDGPQITLVEERTEFLRRNSDRRTKRMEDRHSTCGEISTFSDATPDLIPKPLPDRDLRMDIQNHPGHEEPDGIMCSFSPSMDPLEEAMPAATEPSETDRFLPRTLHNSITKLLSQTSEPLEEEWQCISDLALACNSILEAMSKEGQQALEAGDPAGVGGKTPSQRKTKDEDVARTLSEKVCQLEAVLKKLQDDLQKEKKDKAVLEAEVQSLRQNNQRLQEESQTTVAQLIKVTEMLCSAGGKQL